MSYVTHLEAAIDGTHLPHNELQTLTPTTSALPLGPPRLMTHSDRKSRPQRERRACTAWMSSGQRLLMKASTAQISSSTSLSEKPGILLG